MAKDRNKTTYREAKKDMEDMQRINERTLELQRQELNGLSQIFSLQKKTSNLELEKNRLLEERNKLYDLSQKKMHGNAEKKFKTWSKDVKKNLDDSLKSVEKQLKVRYAIMNLTQSIGRMSEGFTKNLASYLMASDEAMKSVALELGLGSERSAMMRQNIYAASVDAAALGGSVKDMTTIMRTFADETGRAKTLSQGALSNITSISQGTGMGFENAARMAGQFELMGYNVQQTTDYVQGVVDTTERMGVNTSKVFDKIIKNFDRLQSYTFTQGVQGFSEMASYAEKFKIDMDQTLNAVDKSKTLEGAIELAAQLQVMGGEFAKSDPFELLFLSRNRPEEFQKKLNQMTKGIVSFKRNAEGVMETYISPMDQDRLAKVAESLGMSNGELQKQARRMAEIQKLRQQGFAQGISQEEMKIIEGANFVMGERGMFSVQIGNDMVKLQDLNRSMIESLEVQTKSLDQRAKDSQSFSKVLDNTVMQFQSLMLPVLEQLNWALGKVIKAKDAIFGSEFGKSAATIFAASTALVGGASMLLRAGMSIARPFADVKNMMSKSTTPPPSTGSRKRGRAIGKGGGLGGLATGLGVGAAGAGIGAGVMMASKGISGIADSLAKLPEDKVELFKEIVSTLGWFTIGGMVAAGVIIAVGAASKAAAVGLGVLGGAAALVGVGIYAATTGIGSMAESLSKVGDTNLKSIASGVASVAASSLKFADPRSMIGLGAMAGGISSIASNAGDLEKVGNAFHNIKTALVGNKNDFKEVRDLIVDISNADISNSSTINKLADVLSKPLRVEFADKEVGFVANIDLKMDGRRMFDKMNVSRNVAIMQSDYRSGRDAPSAS